MSGLQDISARQFIGRGPWRGVGHAFKQTLAGQSKSPALYLLPDGLEVEQYNPIDIQRQRIFFPDIRMVTLATRTDWTSAGMSGAAAAVFGLAILFIVLASSAPVPSPEAIVAIMLFGSGLVVTAVMMLKAVLVPQQVISIYGRRLCIEWAKVPPPDTIPERYVWLVEKVRTANAAAKERVALLRLAAKPPPPMEIPLPEMPPVPEVLPAEATPLEPPSGNG